MIRILALLSLMAAMAVAQEAPATVTLTYLGQAGFVMSTSTGLKALLDPAGPSMFKNAPVDGVDVVTVTHEHPDHNYVALATGSPTILRGLADGDFAKIDETVKGVHIRTVGTFHDSQQGAQRGKNAVFVFELPGLRVVHLGDLGHLLDPQQIAAIGPADVLLIPVSGGPTIDPKTAIEVADQLSAKVVIPMHYGTGAMAAPGGGRRGPGEPGARGPGAPGGRAPGGRAGGFSLGTLDDFLKVVGSSIKVVQEGHSVTFTAGKLPAERTIMTMKYE